MTVCPIPQTPGSKGSRSNRLGMIRPMAEAWKPRRIRWPEWVGGDVAARRNRIIDLTDLVMWLDVQQSDRWQRTACGDSGAD